MSPKSHNSRNFLKIIRIGLAFFLILFSIAILYSAERIFRSAQHMADQSLESTALALSSSAEIALHRSGPSALQEIFSDRVVAYAMIVNDRRIILFHTNPKRIGFTWSLQEERPESSLQKAVGRRIILGTGLPAYEFNYPLRLTDGASQWLRLVLHTAPVDRIVADARRTWWIGWAVLLLLWTTGILFERMLTRTLRLGAELNRKKQLAVVGQMTAVLAHEIRNALGSVKGYAQWVNEKTDAGDPKKVALTSIIDGTERIEDLVHQLLQFSRDERYHIGRVDVIPLLKEAVASAAAGWNGVRHMDEIPHAVVYADAEKLRRVFVNGIKNAVEAMGGSGRLDISIRPAGKHVTIKMKDTGPGIPETQLPLLFTPFHTTKTDGTGLGLAYCEKVIEGMNGKISLRNRDREQGAVLIIRLPKAGET